MKQIPHLKYKTNGGKYEVIESWEHTALDSSILKITKGYTTNGASVPRVFWWILSPFNPCYIEEATIHDYLCDKGQYQRADAWFEHLLKQNTLIPRWQRKVFIFSVRGWHCLAYQKSGYFVRAKNRYWLKIFNKEQNNENQEKNNI